MDVRAECNYKIGVECEVDGESPEMVQRHIISVAFHDSRKHYGAPSIYAFFSSFY